jgi:hypothetical protein
MKHFLKLEPVVRVEEESLLGRGFKPIEKEAAIILWVFYGVFLS